MIGWLGVIGWMLFGLMLYWHWQREKFTEVRRMNLRSYIIYLLLSNHIREDHRIKFWSWIQDVEAADAASLGLQAQGVIDEMADGLAGADSLLASVGMVWKVKTGQWEDSERDEDKGE